MSALPVKSITDPLFALSATTSSGLTVSYVSSNTSVATVSGNMVTILTTGTSTITASQLGDLNYSAASSVDQPLTVIINNPKQLRLHHFYPSKWETLLLS